MQAAITLTAHGRLRVQQRSISSDLLDLLWAYGSEMRRAGASVLFFDKAARRRLREALTAAELRRLRRQDLCSYVVVGNACQIVTAGYRTKRFRRP